MKHVWMENNSKAIAILRVSSRKQTDGSSHDIQQSEIEKYCADNGLVFAAAPFKITESAKDSDLRTQFHGALEWALKNNVRHVLFYMYDRETRNLSDNERNEKLVRQDRLVLHYVRDNKVLWKNSPDSDFLMRDFHAVQNKQFSRNLSAKVVDSMRRKAENGWFPRNVPPLGYKQERLKDETGRERKRGTIVVPDPLTKTLVQREFELRAAGLSVAAIREQVIKEGLIVSSLLKKYSKNGIDERLRNKFYRGLFDWQGVEYQGKHELIIPASTVAKVDDLLGRRGGRPRPYGASGLFSNWLTCAHPECQRQIVKETAKKKIKGTGAVKEFTYYRCSNSRGVHSSTKGMYCSEQELFKQFGSAVTKISLSEALAERIAKALNEVGDQANSATRQEIAEYQKALDALDDKRNKLFDLFADGQIGRDDYNRQNERLTEERKHFTALLEATQLKINDGWRYSAQTILELATNAKSVWENGAPEKRVEYLKKVCWNPIMEGAKLRYDLKKPFAILCKMQEKEEWRPLLPYRSYLPSALTHQNSAWSHHGLLRTKCFTIRNPARETSSVS